MNYALSLQSMFNYFDFKIYPVNSESLRVHYMYDLLLFFLQSFKIYVLCVACRAVLLSWTETE